jgi:hypothetical protein
MAQISIHSSQHSSDNMECVNSLAQDEIDILGHSSTLQIIVKDLIDKGEGELCNNPASEETHMDASLINYHFNP